MRLLFSGGGDLRRGRRAGRGVADLEEDGDECELVEVDGVAGVEDCPLWSPLPLSYGKRVHVFCSIA